MNICVEPVERLNRQLCTDLERLGIRMGDLVLMHSSFKSLGFTGGTPDDVIDALLKVIGQRGTLVMPTLTYDRVDADHPVFDVNNTSCCVGAMPERFWHREGVLRSLSPTHSAAAFGPLAEQITADQLKDQTPVGEHSPFRRVGELGGKLLFLGCGTQCNTSMHGVEELVCPPYLFEPQPVVYTVKDEKGNDHTVSNKRHMFHKDGIFYAQRYERVTDLLHASQWGQGKVLGAECVWMDAAAVWREGERQLRLSPLYFVDPVPPSQTETDL